MSISKSKNPRILYLSRGRGFSHAMYDSLILRELKKMNKNISVLVASYDKGYTYFLNNRIEAFNLGLKENEELTLKAGFRMWSLIRRFKPDLVVSDEVFIVLHITKALKIPSVLITHWFFETFSKNHPMIPVVKKANHVIFVDTPEFHTIPFDFNVHLTCVGPVIRKFDYTLKDRKRARRELEIGLKDKVILVTPGGRHKNRSELLEICFRAFKDLKDNNLKLIILSGELCEEYSKRYEVDKRVIVKDFDWKMDRLIVASDLVICKGTFMTTWEIAYLGVPSISIPDTGHIDQFHVNRMAAHGFTTKIDPRKLSKKVLLEKIKENLYNGVKKENISKKVKKFINGRGQKDAAEEINYLANKALK